MLVSKFEYRELTDIVDCSGKFVHLAERPKHMDLVLEDSIRWQRDSVIVIVNSVNDQFPALSNKVQSPFQDSSAACRFNYDIEPVRVIAV